MNRVMRQFILVLSVVALIGTQASPVAANAINTQDTAEQNAGSSLSDFYTENNIYLYDTSGGQVTCVGSDGSTQLIGNDNIEQAFNYFLSKNNFYGDKKFTREQSAGIVGNLIVESGGKLDPAVKQYGGGPGRGIAQWEVGGRWDVLLKWAGDQRPPREPINILTQLDFLYHEFETTEKTAFKAVSDSRDVYEAAAQFMLKFERPKNQSVTAQKARGEIANSVLTKYGSGAGTGTPTTGTITGATSCAGGSGNGTVDTNGYSFPVGPQKQSENVGLSVPCNRKGCHHDGTPAADISRKPGGRAAEGAPVYAITDGTIASLKGLNSGGGVSNNCYIMQFLGRDTYYYGYLHIKNPSVREGQQVTAGTQIAEIGNLQCGYNTVEHLHIDRGCTRNGIPQRGGADSCRDPAFVPLLDSIFYNMPE